MGFIVLLQAFVCLFLDNVQVPIRYDWLSMELAAGCYSAATGSSVLLVLFFVCLLLLLLLLLYDYYYSCF